MPRLSIEQQFKDIVDQGYYTMDADDMRAMDLEVHASSKADFDAYEDAWNQLAGVPLFPREDLE